MKANELRIGNWTSINGYWVNVYEIANGVIEISNGVDPYSIHDINPIPLTEEWLLKFGFNKGMESGRSLFGGYKYRNYYYIQLEFENWQYRLVKKTINDDWVLHQGFISQWSTVKESIDYVHQLQNLYFALTGEELTIK